MLVLFLLQNGCVWVLRSLWRLREVVDNQGQKSDIERTVQIKLSFCFTFDLDSSPLITEVLLCYNVYIQPVGCWFYRILKENYYGYQLYNWKKQSSH